MIARSGMFSNAEVRALAQGWRRDPASLLDALLADVDEVTVKRGEVTQANLNQATSPSPDAISGSGSSAETNAPTR